MMGQKLTASLVLASVFVLGAVTGIFIDRHHAISASEPLSPTELHEAAMTQLREVLQLDDEQLTRVHEILAERQISVQRAWEQMRPEVQEAMRGAHTEIAALLSPEQRERFHEWMLEQRRQLEGESGVLILPH